MKISVKQAKEWISKGLIKNPGEIDYINSLNDNKVSKYKNKKVMYNGIMFDSIKEMNRYKELVILEKVGLIKDLVLQETFVLIAPSKKSRGLTYRCDFSYFDVEKGIKVVEDVKSKITAKLRTYKDKKKLMKAIHGIDIKEVIR